MSESIFPIGSIAGLREWSEPIWLAGDVSDLGLSDDQRHRVISTPLRSYRVPVYHDLSCVLHRPHEEHSRADVRFVEFERTERFYYWVSNYGVGAARVYQRR